jgi:hypothetical protein
MLAEMNMQPISIAIAAILLGGCCSNDVVSRTITSDGSWEAVVYERSCGTTTPLGTQISIQRSGHRSVRGAGNVFQIEPPGDYTGVPPAMKATATWVGDRHLRVSYDDQARITFAVVKIGNIAIEYEPY